MAGANAVLNSSLEIGDDWLHAVAGSLPTSWQKSESVAGAANITPRLDFSQPQHGIVSALIQDAQILASGGSIDMFQESVATMSGVGSPNVASVYLEGYTNSLDFRLAITYHDAAHAVIGTTYTDWTHAQLLALGSLNGPVRLSTTGNVPATTHHVSISASLRKNTAGSTPAAGEAAITIDRVQYENGSAPTAYGPADGYQGGGNGAGPKDAPDVYSSGEYLLTAPSPLTSLKLNDHNSIAAEGYDLIVENVEGLYPLPDIKSSGDYEDNAYHGGVAGVEHYASRVITMDLALRANSEALYNRKLSALKRALASTSSDRKLVFKRIGIEGLSKKFINVRVRRVGGFDSNYKSSRGFGRGSLQLVAHDPAMYDAISNKATAAPGAGVTVPTAFTGWNAVAVPGIFRSYPIVTITGPVTDPHIYRTYAGVISAEENYTGDFILATTIPAGQSVTVDFKARTVTHSSGADWREYIDDASKWWSIYPLPGATVSLGVSANPNVSGFSAALEWWTAWL